MGGTLGDTQWQHGLEHASRCCCVRLGGGGMVAVAVTVAPRVQVCAAGALLNVLGPHVTRGGDAQRLGMCRVLSMTMALASVYSSCFGAAPGSLPSA